MSTALKNVDVRATLHGVVAALGDIEADRPDFLGMCHVQAARRAVLAAICHLLDASRCEIAERTQAEEV